MRRALLFLSAALLSFQPAAANELCESLLASGLVSTEPALYVRSGEAGAYTWVPAEETAEISATEPLAVALAATADAPPDIYVLKIGELRQESDKVATSVHLVRDFHSNPFGCGLRNSIINFILRGDFEETVSVRQYAAYHAILSKVSQELGRFHINYTDADGRCHATDDDEVDEVDAEYGVEANIYQFLFGDEFERMEQKGDAGELIAQKLRAMTDSAFADTLKGDADVARFFAVYQRYRALEVRIVPHLTQSRVCHAFVLRPRQLERTVDVVMNELLARDGGRLEEKVWELGGE